MNAEAGFARNAVPGSDAGDPWDGFANPADAAGFINAWFGVLLSDIPHAKTALLLLEHSQGGFAQAAAWPDAQTDVAALREMAQKAAAAPGQSLLEVTGDGTRLIAYPVAVEGTLHAVIALSAGAMSGRTIENAMRRLHWGAGWLHSLVLKQREIDSESARKRAAAALEIIAALEDEPGLEAGLRVLANELQARIGADRISVAIKGRRRLKIRAVSETSDAERRSRDMRQLRQALEEARLQGRMLVFPPLETDSVSILAAHRAHARMAGVSAMMSVPIILNGETLGVVGFERMGGEGEGARPFDAEAAGMAEAILASTAPVIRFKRRAHRLLSGRLPELVAEGWRRVFGRGYPVLKFALLAGAVAITLLAVTPVPLNVDARAVTMSTVQRVIAAPFDGYVASAGLRAGDSVAQGQVIATLDASELELEIVRWQSEIARLTQERRQMMAEGDRVGVALANARTVSARAELELVQSRLARIELTAPFDGLIVQGDLSQSLGAPVGEGDVLFEIAFGDAYKAALHISEYDVALIEAGATGQLALMGMSVEPVPITLSSVSPVSEPGENSNVFVAEADLPGGIPGMRPGLEGTAKIRAGESSLLYALTRPLLVRLRYLVWQWTP